MPDPKTPTPLRDEVGRSSEPAFLVSQVDDAAQRRKQAEVDLANADHKLAVARSKVEDHVRALCKRCFAGEVADA